MTAPSYRSHGFTLIELSIVLVIIGLIVGGVLVGRDLIHAAEIRATVAQVEKFNAAVNTFRTKYNCLPGDCVEASAFGMDPASNGNGDGVIGLCSFSAGCRFGSGGMPNTNVMMGESLNFWYHLSAAELIADSFSYGGSDIPGIGTPRPRIIKTHTLYSGWPGGWDIQADAPFDSFYGGGSLPAHNFILASLTAYGSITNVGFYAPADIQAIDAKMDNGLPLSGTVRAYVYARTIYVPFAGDAAGTIYFGSTNSFSADGIGPGGSSATVCVRNDTIPFQYNVQWSGTGGGFPCGMVVKASF